MKSDAKKIEKTDIFKDNSDKTTTTSAKNDSVHAAAADDEDQSKPDALMSALHYIQDEETRQKTENQIEEIQSGKTAKRIEDWEKCEPISKKRKLDTAGHVKEQVISEKVEENESIPEASEFNGHRNEKQRKKNEKLRRLLHESDEEEDDDEEKSAEQSELREEIVSSSKKRKRVLVESENEEEESTHDKIRADYTPEQEKWLTKKFQKLSDAGFKWTETIRGMHEEFNKAFPNSLRALDQIDTKMKNLKKKQTKEKEED